MLIVLGNRLDTRINLAIFERLMTLPLDFFECNRAGEIAYKVSQLYRVREFLTAWPITTFIDIAMVSAAAAGAVLHGGGACLDRAGRGLLHRANYRGIPQAAGGDEAASSSRRNPEKGSTLVESVYGIRTVKSLGLEAARAAEWILRVAKAGELNLQMGQLNNWPMVLVMPFEKYTSVGVLALGAYIAMNTDNPLSLGGLIGFMMLGRKGGGAPRSISRGFSRMCRKCGRRSRRLAGFSTGLPRNGR